MPTARTRRWIWALGTLVLLGLSFGAGRWLAPSLGGPPVDVAAAEPRISGTLGVDENPREPLPPAPGLRDAARPLPPLDAPLRLIASELAARATQGDAQAACRLAAEYEWCDALNSARSMAAVRVAQLPPLQAGQPAAPDLFADERQVVRAELDTAEGRFVRHCADAPPLDAARRVNYWRQAALQGHPAALRHYAIGNAFRFHDLLDALPELERYRREGGALALRAANAGDLAMMYALAMAHTEGSDGGYRPFLAQTLAPDAGRALVWFRRLQAAPAVQRLPETHALRQEIESYLSSLARLVPPNELQRAEAALAGYRAPSDTDPLPQAYPNGGLFDVARNDCDQAINQRGPG